jgi:hypothetical protein
MTKFTMFTAAMAMAAAVSVAAQTAGTTASDDKTAKPMAADKMAAEKEMSHTGCVATGPTAGTYMLSTMTADTAMKPAGAMPPDAGAMGKDTMPHDASMPMSIMLMGSKVDFSKHVGHKVSVTGTMNKAGMMGKDATANPATMTPGSMPMASMTVSSVKMISTSCDK